MKFFTKEGSNSKNVNEKMVAMYGEIVQHIFKSSIAASSSNVVGITFMITQNLKDVWKHELKKSLTNMKISCWESAE